MLSPTPSADPRSIVTVSDSGDGLPAITRATTIGAGTDSRMPSTSSRPWVRVASARSFASALSSSATRAFKASFSRDTPPRAKYRRQSEARPSASPVDPRCTFENALNESASRSGSPLLDCTCTEMSSTCPRLMTRSRYSVRRLMASIGGAQENDFRSPFRTAEVICLVQRDLTE